MKIKNSILFFKTDCLKRNLVLAAALFLLIAIIYTIYVFSFVGHDEFLVINDAPNFLGITDMYNKSFVRYLDDGGISNGFQTSMNFINFIVFGFLYWLGLSIKNVQILFFIFISFAVNFISFIGFYKLNDCQNKLKHNKKDLLIAFIPTVFYYYSLFNILNINSGIIFRLHIFLTHYFLYYCTICITI